MKSTLKVAILAIALGGVSAPVFAYADDQWPPTDQQPIARKSFYIDGNLGVSSLATPKEFIDDCDPANYTGCYSAGYKTGGLVVGGDIGYRFALIPSFLLGAETGYSYNGQSKYTADYRLLYPLVLTYYSTSLKIKSEDIHLLATGTYMFHNGFNLFVKGGAARVTQKLDVNTQSWINGYYPIPTEASSFSAIKPMAAFGIGFQHGMFNANLQVSHIFADHPKDFDDMMDMNTLKMDKIVSVETVKLAIGVTIPVR